MHYFFIYNVMNYAGRNVSFSKNKPTQFEQVMEPKEQSRSVIQKTSFSPRLGTAQGSCLVLGLFDNTSQYDAQNLCYKYQPNERFTM